MFKLQTAVFLIFTCFAPAVVTIGKPPPLVKGNPNDPKYLTIAWRAVKSLSEKFNDSEFYYIPNKVVEATQTAAGSFFRVKAEFGESTCSRKDVKVEDVTAANCGIKENGKLDMFEIDLSEEIWKKFARLTVSKVK